MVKPVAEGVRHLRPMAKPVVKGVRLRARKRTNSEVYHEGKEGGPEGLGVKPTRRRPELLEAA